MTGKLIIFSAPSGSGKSTIINYLLTQNLNLAFSNTATRMFQFIFLLPAVFRVVRSSTEWNISFLRRRNSVVALRTTNFWSMRKYIRTVITER